MQVRDPRATMAPFGLGKSLALPASSFVRDLSRLRSLTLYQLIVYLFHGDKLFIACHPRKLQAPLQRPRSTSSAPLLSSRWVAPGWVHGGCISYPVAGQLVCIGRAFAGPRACTAG